jgi:hypothetical protein
MTRTSTLCLTPVFAPKLLNQTQAAGKQSSTSSRHLTSSTSKQSTAVPVTKMGKRNDRLAPEVIKSQPCGVAEASSSSLSSSSLGFKRQRVPSNADEDSSLESADQIALTLVRMRFNKVPALPTQPEKALVPDCTHVTDDEEEDDDAEETPTLPLAASGAICRTGKLLGPLVAMALPRPPPLPRPLSSPPLPLEQRQQQQIRFPYLPEGRPLPPAPILPSLRTWSTVPAPAGHRSKE